MSRLARSEPGYSAFGNLPAGTISPNIILNRYQMQAELVNERILASQAIDLGDVTADSVSAGYGPWQFIPCSCASKIAGDIIRFSSSPNCPSSPA